MNRITIDRNIYDLGKVQVRKLTLEQWRETSTHLRRDDKAHVIKIGDELYFVVQAKLDPKYHKVELYFRTMTLAYVMPELPIGSQGDDAPSIRRIRDAGRGEL